MNIQLVLLTLILSPILVPAREQLPAKFLGPEIHQGNEAVCEYCTEALAEVSQILSQPEVKKEILSLVEIYVCPLFNHFEATCKKLVQVEGNVVLSILEKYINPKLCHELPLICPKNQTKPIETSSILDCEKCKLVIKLAKKTIESKRSEIKTLMERVCNSELFPNDEKAKCHSLIDSYLDQVFQYIEHNLQPLEICQRLSMC